MEHNVFPMKEEDGITTLHLVNLSHISHFVEVNQLGYQNDGKIWVHTDPISGQQHNISQEVTYFNILHSLLFFAYLMDNNTIYLKR